MLPKIKKYEIDRAKKRKELLVYFQKTRELELWQYESRYIMPSYYYDFELHGIYKHDNSSLYEAASKVFEAIIPREYTFNRDLCLFLSRKFTAKEIRQLLYSARKISRNTKHAVDSIDLASQKHGFFIPEYMMQLDPLTPSKNPSLLLLDLPSPSLAGTSFHYMPVKYLFRLILNGLPLSDLLTMRQVSRAFRRLVNIGSIFCMQLYVESSYCKYINQPFWFEVPYRLPGVEVPKSNRSIQTNRYYAIGLPFICDYLCKYISSNKSNPDLVPRDSAYLLLYSEEKYLSSLGYELENGLQGFGLSYLNNRLLSPYYSKSINTYISQVHDHCTTISNPNQDAQDRFSRLAEYYQNKMKEKNTRTFELFTSRWDFNLSDDAFYKLFLSEADRPEELQGEPDPMVIKALREKVQNYLKFGLSREDSLCRAYKENILGIVKYLPISIRGLKDFMYQFSFSDPTLDEFFLQLGKIDISVAIALAVSIHVWELRPDQVSNKTLGELIRYYCEKHSKQFRKVYPGDQLVLIEFRDLMTAYINVRAWSMSRETVLEWSQIHPLVFGQLLLHPPFQLFLHEGEIVLECEREELVHSPLQLEKSNVMGYLTTSFDKKPKNNESEIYPDKKPEICPEKEYADFCLFHHLSEEAIKQSFYLANGTIGSRLVSIETQEMFKQKGIELIGWQERPESFYQDSPRLANKPSEPQGSSETVLTDKNRSSRWGYLTLLPLCGLGFSLVGGGAWSLAGHPGLVMAGLLIHKLAFTVGSVCAVILGGLLLFAALYLGLRLLRRGNASNEHKSHSYNSYQQFYQQELTAPSQAINTETHTETHGVESREDFKRVVSMGLRPKKATGQAPISLDSETGPSAELPQYH